jgi:glyceraldehyde 3-phosphate dehydrogenase
LPAALTVLPSASRPRTSRSWTSSSSPSARPPRRVNAAVKRAAEQQLKGILSFTEAPNVSTDFNHDPHSAVFHMDQTKVIDGTLVRVMSWYDNEWGFSNRMIDTAVAMGKLI